MVNSKRLMGGPSKEPVECYSKCPWCGSEKRLIKDYIIELEESGELSKGAFPRRSGAWEIPFLDQKKLNLIQVQAPRPCPMLKILFDVCGECHKLYITGVEYGGILFQQVTPQHVGHIQG